MERLYGPARPGALGGGVRELLGWSRRSRAWLVALALLAIAAGLVLFADVLTIQQAAVAAYLLVALYGLRVLATDTAQPSLGHVAFLAVGAYLTALLRLRANLDGLTSAALSAVAAGALGWLVGWGASRLSPAFVALATWAFGWLVFVTLGAFPAIGGGSAGITLTGQIAIRVSELGLELRFNEVGHLLLALTLLGVVMLLVRSAEGSGIGLRWAALRDSSSMASSLGYDVGAMRRWAFFASAGLAGLAGSLTSQLLGVVDPTLYNPVVSLSLFAAVLIGSRAGFLGPVLGLLVTAGIPALLSLGFPAATAFGTALQGVTVAVLTLLALALALRAPRHPSGMAAAEGTGAASPAPRTARRRVAEPILVVRGLRRQFGGVVALDSVDLAIARGAIHGLIGPNGSGKSTMLRCLAGAIPADAGEVALDGSRVDRLGQAARSREGMGRTFQRTVLLPELTPAEHLEVGLLRTIPDHGWLQALLQTPGYRASARLRRATALEMLTDFGLEQLALIDPATLSAGRQRILMIAAASAAGPKLLLLDEPSAGMQPDEIALLEQALRGLRQRGVTLLLVEHNMGFLRRLADRITVLDEGRVLAEGAPARIAANPRVRAAYLG